MTTTTAPRAVTYITLSDEQWRTIVEEAHTQAAKGAVRAGVHKSGPQLLYAGDRILARKDAGTVHKCKQVATGRVDIFPKLELPARLIGKPDQEVVAHLVGWLLASGT